MVGGGWPSGLVPHLDPSGSRTGPEFESQLPHRCNTSLRTLYLMAVAFAPT